MPSAPGLGMPELNPKEKEISVALPSPESEVSLPSSEKTEPEDMTAPPEPSEPESIPVRAEEPEKPVGKESPPQPVKIEPEIIDRDPESVAEASADNRQIGSGGEVKP